MKWFRRLGWPALLLAGLTLVSLSVPVQARPVNSESVVKITTEASQPDAEGRQVVTLTLAIAKDWHIYANPIGNKDLEGAQTEVAIKGSQPLQDVKLVYPPGKPHEDRTVGDYNVYENTVVIKGQVRRAPGDAGPLEVTIKLQSCNFTTKQCLFPATVKRTVK